MFTLTICVGSASWPLVYKTEESAEQAYNVVLESSVGTVIEDDFGQRAYIASGALKGALLEDMDKVKLAHIERQLYAARLNVDAQHAARSDPKLMAAARGQGPSVITPMGNGMTRM